MLIARTFLINNPHLTNSNVSYMTVAANAANAPKSTQLKHSSEQRNPNARTHSKELECLAHDAEQEETRNVFARSTSASSFTLRRKERSLKNQIHPCYRRNIHLRASRPLHSPLLNQNAR